MDIIEEIREAYQRAQEDSFKVNAILVPIQRANELHLRYIEDGLHFSKDGKKVLNGCVIIHAFIDKIEIAYIV